MACCNNNTVFSIPTGIEIDCESTGVNECSCVYHDVCCTI